MISALPPVAIFQTWLSRHPHYTYTVLCYETNADGTPVTSTLRITFDEPTHTETLHVISGRGAGTDARWTGGDTIEVHPPGFLHGMTMRFGVRSAQVLSPRGNDIRAADLTRVAACFVSDEDHVQADIADDRVTLVDEAPHCTEGYGQDNVTVDRLIIDAVDGHPIMRERYEGTTVVERWTISNIETTP